MVWLKKEKGYFILDLEKIYSENTFDVIVTNPPYKKMNTGILNENEKKT